MLGITGSIIIFPLLEFMFCRRPLLQRLSRSLAQGLQVGQDAIRSSRAREFFKKRWLQRIYSRGKTPRPEVPLIRDSTIRIRIDTREQGLGNALSKFPIPFETVQLTEGDIVITSGSSRCKRVVIERKSIEDFYNSLRTNRLFDQMARIFEANAKQQSTECLFLLVLEGRLSPDATASPCVYTTVSNMYQSLLLRDRIPVIRTDSVDDTARLILSLSSRLPKLFSTPNEYSSLVHVERSGRKISGVNVPYMKLLMSIKGVSSNRASAITSVHSSMDGLVSAIKQDGGILKLAQLVCPSANRAVGSVLGMATALNIAEALLGPIHPEVGVFRLVKWLGSLQDVKIPNGEAIRIANEYKSLACLRLRYLEACSTGDVTALDKIPESLQNLLARTVDDPHVLLAGLKGVRLISAKTAELLTLHFKNVRTLHAEISKHKDCREEVITHIRMVGTSSQKRMIARSGVENILNWLQTEGFSPPLGN